MRWLKFDELWLNPESLAFITVHRGMVNEVGDYPVERVAFVTVGGATHEVKERSAIAKLLKWIETIESR